MNEVQKRQSALVSEFSQIAEWEDRYKKIIDLGKALPGLADEHKIERNIIKGCQSQVWLVAKLNDKGEMILEGDSDALLVKGLVAVMLRVYSGVMPEDILKSDTQFLKDMGFESHLSPSRANGVHSMLKQIKLFATAFSLLKQRT
ncbi:MAG: SufE family protein [Bdellovibrionia bacterium]